MNAQKTEALTFLIKKGPNHERLHDCFRLAYDRESSIRTGWWIEVDPTIPDSDYREIKTVEVSDLKPIIMGYADNTGQNYDLKGCCYWRFNEVGSFEYCKYEASYNVETRCGIITLFIPKD